MSKLSMNPCYDPHCLHRTRPGLLYCDFHDKQIQMRKTIAAAQDNGEIGHRTAAVLNYLVNNVQSPKETDNES